MSELPSDRQFLEDALARDPEDDSTWAAYADLLIERGDPRGEYVQLCLAIEADNLPPPQKRELEVRRSELFRRHERDWLGGLASAVSGERASEYDPTWRRGWIDRLTIHVLLAPAAPAFAAAPELRLLRELTIGSNVYWPAYSTAYPEPRDNGLRALAGSPHFGCVRSLQLGQPDEYGCHADAEGVSELVRAMPRLESLALAAQNPDTPNFFALPLPHLRKLRVDFATLYPLELLAANDTLTRLDTLHLDARMYDGGGDEEGVGPATSLSQVEALAHSPHLGALRTLRLRLPGVGDRGCRVLLESGIVGRLDVLDLRGAGLTDASAELLARSADVARLRRLNVGNNAFGPAGVARLEAIDTDVVADEQMTLDDDGGDW